MSVLSVSSGLSGILCSQSVICSDKKRASGVFPARMADFQAAVQCACVSNWWAQKIRSRFEFAQDLQAADAVYHQV